MSGGNGASSQQAAVRSALQWHHPEATRVLVARWRIELIKAREFVSQVGGAAIEEINECPALAKQGLIDKTRQLTSHISSDIRCQLRIKLHVFGHGRQLLDPKPLLRKACPLYPSSWIRDQPLRRSYDLDQRTARDECLDRNLEWTGSAFDDLVALAIEMHWNQRAWAAIEDQS